MVIYGIGTDLVKTERVQRLWRRYGSFFSRRILSEQELIAFEHSKKKSYFLAKRFAAKEAIVKALGTGFRGEIFLTGIEISNNDLGKPQVSFCKKTKQYVDKLGELDIHLSLADEKDYVLAFCVASIK